MAAETLRSATVSLTGMAQDPVVDRFDRSETVSIEATRYLGPVDDGRYVGLSDLRGDLDAARELLAGVDRVERYDVAGTGEHGIVYAHYRSAGLTGDLLSILYRNDIVVDWPIDHRPADEPRTQLTVVGTAVGIRRAVAALPDQVSLSVERVGRFDPDGADSLLTERQAALLDLAVREGYYEVPRGTTHRALADRLDLAPGTVSDRLQRIERRVMTAYVADRA
ncbi:helix-turn-helix domain-containing protein [Halococcus hamelinensis]|uniref:DNA-binding protein n=1 Tax=Halococcus hamelinensis 100A6 TaxID=1132509 RepID=M0M7A3_9EURY|nr:helix-turn-helix domain-containing protein [Halococcus hamelinensis]EMA41278.1 DNA-binding protein [Halococcus hamelinensis 100A6]